MKKIFTLITMIAFAGMASAQILTFEFSALAGGEATAGSNANDANLTTSTISRGSGLTATGNTGRYNSNAITTATSLDVNDYVEFAITPQSGKKFSISSIVVQHQRSGTGPLTFALRSSVDNFATDLGAVSNGTDVTTTQTATFTFTLTDATSAITYRLYPYASEAGTGTWGPGDGVGDDIVVNGTTGDAPLPISLVKFTATKLAEKVKVSWATATEINNDKFIIERSADGENFERVTEVRGAGNSKELNAYEVVDANPLKGTSYYRLTQYDFNGESETFAPVAVSMKQGALSVELGAGSMEQGAGSMGLKVYSPLVTEATISVRDLSGRTLYSEKINLQEGYQNFNIATANFGAGIYLISLNSDTEVVMKKVKL